MKRFLFLLLIAAIAFGTQATRAMADDSPSNNLKPVAVVSLAGCDALKSDIDFLQNLSTDPQLSAGLGFVRMFAAGLEGLDKARPWGAALFADGDKVTGYGFIPVTDLAKLQKTLEPFIGKAEDMGDGVYKVEDKKNHKPPLFVKEGKGWAFLADNVDKLTNLPEDPAALLAGLEKQYQVAVRFNPVNVPENLRVKFNEEMNKGAKRDAAKKPDESDEEHALRLKITEAVVKHLQNAVTDLHDVTLGWNLDTKTGASYLEASVVAKAGSKLASCMPSGNLQSKFAGFNLADAALAGNVNGFLPAIKIDLLNEVFEVVHKKIFEDIEKKEHDAAKVDIHKKLVEKVLPVIHDTIVNGRVDKGFSVVLKPDALTVVVGSTVANNGRIEELAQFVLTVVKQQHPEKASDIDSWVRLNAEKLGDLSLHTISIPIPGDAKDREKVVPLIGETLEIVIGTGRDSLYIAAGREPMAALKKAIEQSAADAAKNVPPLDISISLTKVAEFIAVAGKPHERPQAAKLAEALKQSPSTDHLTLRAAAIENGVKYRLELEPGVLKAFAQMHDGK